VECLLDFFNVGGVIFTAASAIFRCSREKHPSLEPLPATTSAGMAIKVEQKESKTEKPYTKPDGSNARVLNVCPDVIPPHQAWRNTVKRSRAQPRRTCQLTWYWHLLPRLSPATLYTMHTNPQKIVARNEPRQEDLPSNANAPWTSADDKNLEKEFRSGSSVHTLAAKNQRTRGAIRSRLKKLGLSSLSR